MAKAVVDKDTCVGCEGLRGRVPHQRHSTWRVGSPGERRHLRGVRGAPASPPAPCERHFPVEPPLAFREPDPGSGSFLVSGGIPMDPTRSAP